MYGKQENWGYMHVVSRMRQIPGPEGCPRETMGVTEADPPSSGECGSRNPHTNGQPMTTSNRYPSFGQEPIPATINDTLLCLQTGT